jgi:hypothetical protein
LIRPKYRYKRRATTISDAIPRTHGQHQRPWHAEPPKSAWSFPKQCSDPAVRTAHAVASARKASTTPPRIEPRTLKGVSRPNASRRCRRVINGDRKNRCTTSAAMQGSGEFVAHDPQLQMRVQMISSPTLSRPLDTSRVSCQADLARETPSFAIDPKRSLRGTHGGRVGWIAVARSRCLNHALRQ